MHMPGNHLITVIASVLDAAPETTDNTTTGTSTVFMGQLGELGNLAATSRRIVYDR